MTENFTKRKLDVLGVSETHLKGCNVWECVNGNEGWLWDG